MADVNFRIGKLDVGAISSSSGVFVGQSVQTGWRGTSKENSGFGTTTGMGNQANVRSAVNDADFVDTIRVPRPRS